MLELYKCLSHQMFQNITCLYIYVFVSSDIIFMCLSLQILYLCVRLFRYFKYLFACIIVGVTKIMK